ncbi:MAG: hypothetical protein BGO29_13390 [Bacteroidales bacterium 36-12]|nr:MAG: hypothetical protein BGO29_13390 [Bacteroidales bacterium 36-12]
MNASQIESTYKSVISLLLAGKLKLAFDKTRLLVYELNRGDIKDNFEDMVRNYRFMLQYFVAGVDDPERKTIYNKQVAKLINLISTLKEELMFRNSTNFEYTQKRYYPHKLHFQSTSALFDSLQYFHKQSELVDTTISLEQSGTTQSRYNFEKLLPDLFAIYWLSTNFQEEDKAVFQKITHKDYPGIVEKCLITSALTLNLWRMFDEEKLIMLLDICQHENIQIRQRALVGLCFIYTKYDDILKFYPSIRNRLVILFDNSTITENLKNIFFLIIGTSETDKITKRMREEILPEVMKMSPIIKDKLDAENLIKSDEWGEENPEWNEILEQSGIADKLQELTELQLEGADVYMSTFSMLKNFSFFNETSNWFLPFDPEYSAVESLFQNNEKSILTAFLNNSIICNSDKYSFCLSVMQMPQTQRKMMSNSFKMESEQLEEITKDETLLKPDIAARNIARQYVQDLFRFFRINPHHTDFQDIFKLSLKMHNTTFFSLLSSSSEIKTQVAEYYFTKKLYSQAINLFSEIIQESEPSAALYQKIGFAYQQNSQIHDALQAYLKSDIILPDDVWTIKKIAFCYRIIGDFEKAIEFYKHADFLKPNQVNTKIQIAKCLVRSDKHKEALQAYMEIEQSAPDNEMVLRSISWCAFVTRNIPQAEYYLEKILSALPTNNDFLNAGHIALCKKDRKGALEFYKKSVELSDGNLQLNIDQINSDKGYLKANGVDEDEISLLLDELSFTIEPLE